MPYTVLLDWGLVSYTICALIYKTLSEILSATKNLSYVQILCKSAKVGVIPRQMEYMNDVSRTEIQLSYTD